MDDLYIVTNKLQIGNWLEKSQSNINTIVCFLKDAKEEINQSEEMQHMDRLRKRKNDLITKKCKLESDLFDLKKPFCPNIVDEQAMNNMRKRVTLFEEITGIKWDCANLGKKCKGYIKNENNYYLNAFEFEYKNGQANIDDLINEMEKAASGDWSDLKNPQYSKF